MSVEQKSAIIDIGSNSVRLVAYDLHSRAPVPMFNEKSLCGLGREVAVTGFLPMVIVFPWLGLASWRAYREMVAADGMLAPEAGLPADGGPDPAPTAP